VFLFVCLYSSSALHCFWKIIGFSLKFFVVLVDLPIVLAFSLLLYLFSGSSSSSSASVVRLAFSYKNMIVSQSFVYLVTHASFHGSRKETTFLFTFLALASTLVLTYAVVVA